MAGSIVVAAVGSLSDGAIVSSTTASSTEISTTAMGAGGFLPAAFFGFGDVAAAGFATLTVSTVSGFWVSNAVALAFGVTAVLGFAAACGLAADGINGAGLVVDFFAALCAVFPAVCFAVLLATTVLAGGFFAFFAAAGLA